MGGYADTYVTNLEGNISYHLTGNTRSYPLVKPYWPATIILFKKEMNVLTKVSEKSSASLDWISINMDSTLTLKSTDTLVIRLAAGFTESSRGTVYFDNISFVKK